METAGQYKIHLGQILNLIRNGYSGKQVDKVTEFPVSRIETISNGEIDYKKVGYVESIPSSYKLKNGDILLSNINSIKHIGKVALYKGEQELYHGMNLLILRLQETVDKIFIYYYLDFNKQWFEKMASQAVNQASINQTVVNEFELTIPKNKEEQTQIANILSTIDKAIEQTEAIIAKQQRIKTGLMQDLLTKGIDEHGNIRSEATHKFKDSPLGRIPVEWGISSLDDEIEIIDCKHITPQYAAEGIPIIRPRNIKIDGLNLTDVEYVSEKEYKILTDKHEPQKGDILFSRNASFGIPVFIDCSSKLCIGQDVVVMTQKTANTKYIYYALLSDDIKRQINIVSGGSTFGRIDLGAIRKLILPIPDKQEQDRIVLILDLNDIALAEMKKEFSKYKRLKTGLMQDLLTGNVRVTQLLE